MSRPSRHIGGRLAAALLAGLLLVIGVGTGPADAGLSASQTANLVGGALPVSAASDCPIPSDGDVLQGPDDRAYLYTNGTLRAIPDRETLRVLGFDPNGVDLIPDNCFRAMRFGVPLPSVGAGNQPGRSAAETSAAPRDPSAPAVLLDVSDVQPSRRTSVRLTARTDIPDGGGLVLSIHRAPAEGGTGTSGLVTTCSNTTSCTVQVWEGEATTWTYVATLYRCSAPGVCVAVQESTPVGVAIGPHSAWVRLLCAAFVGVALVVAATVAGTDRVAAQGGNGTVDVRDFPSLQAAVDSIRQTGGAVYVPAGCLAV